MRQYSQRCPARRATSARTWSLMSLATGEDLASFRLGHSQDVLKLHEMVQLRHLFRRQAFFLLSLDQLSDSALRFGRGQELSNRFRGCARGDELDNLEIGGVGRTHPVLILHHERRWPRRCSQ